MSASDIEIVQRSPEWYAARLGKATGSRISDVVAKPKSGNGPSASRKNYHAQLVSERLTGVVQDSYKSGPMERGNDVEPEARAAYAFYSGDEVTEVGFVLHPTIGMTGASPDGLVGRNGLVQFKVPNTATHLETLLGGSIPGAYITQMQWEMACTGRKHCDFVSYDNRLPEAMRLFVKHIPRDDAKIAELEREVIKFLAEVDATVNELRRLYEPTNTEVPILKAG